MLCAELKRCKTKINKVFKNKILNDDKLLLHKFIHKIHLYYVCIKD